MPDTLTSQELAAIREDIAKYPTGRVHGPGPHDPVTYARALLAHIDALTAAVRALPSPSGELHARLVLRDDVLAILRGEQ